MNNPTPQQLAWLESKKKDGYTIYDPYKSKALMVVKVFKAGRMHKYLVNPDGLTVGYTPL